MAQVAWNDILGNDILWPKQLDKTCKREVKQLTGKTASRASSQRIL